MTPELLKYSLAELTKEHPTPTYMSAAWLAHRMLAMGFTGDYKMTHNVYRCGAFVVDALPDLTDHSDFLWLCNRVAKTYRTSEGKDPCRDNDRLCRGPNKTASYKRQVAQGCCGFYDVRLVNPKTGNSFWLGYNYGH